MMHCSQSRKDGRGRHVWDESKQLVNTPYGLLEMWSEGEIGGSSETHHAQLRSYNVLKPPVLVAFAVVFNLLHGDCIKTTIIPIALNGPSTAEEAIGYEWVYWPSTN